MLQYDVFRPAQGINEAGNALSRMLAEESIGKSYADAMRARVSGLLAGECTDTYFVAHEDGACVSRLWYGWGTHESAIGNFGNFLTLESRLKPRRASFTALFSATRSRLAILQR